MDVNKSEALYLVKYLKDKIAIATSMIMIKLSKRDGFASVEFTKQFQEQYIMDHQYDVHPVLENNFLSSCQNEAIGKLRKTIDVPIKLSAKVNHGDSTLFGGHRLDWFEEAFSCGPTEIENTIHTSSSLVTTSKKVLSSEDYAFKNIQFVESIMRLNNECERKSPIPTSVIEYLLDDDADYVSQPNCTSSFANVNKKLSEDSGIWSTNSTEQNRKSVNFVSGNVIKSSLRSTSSHHLAVQSMRCVIKYVKNEINLKTDEVFSNWKGSLVEYACDVLKQSCEFYADCKKMLVNLVIEILDDFWSDTRLAQQRLWEMKLEIINELLTSLDSCYEILHYLSEKIIYFTRILEKKNRPSGYALTAEKLNLILNLYCSVCRTIKKSKTSGKSAEDKEIDLKEDDLTRLWRERFCRKEEEEKENLGPSIEEDQIRILERLIIYTSHRYPVIAMLTMQALTEVKSLKELQENRQYNDDLFGI